MHILLITELYPEYEDQPPLEMNPALHHFVTEWRASGVEVTVIVPVVIRKRFRFGPGTLLKKMTINGVRVVRITMPKMPGFKIYQCAAIVRFSRTIPFDVIVSHMQIGLVAGDAVKKESGKPLIFGVHRSDNTVLDIPSPNLKKRLFKRTFLQILGRVDGFAFRSFSVKHLFLRNYDISNRPETIALSGVPSSFLDPAPEFSYCKIPHIVTTCKLIKQKNVHTVIQALAMLPKNLPWQYTIVGDGPERAALKKLVQRWNVSCQITFLGSVARQKNIRILREADIFVMVSELETLGMVYLEALAQGTLTIGSRDTGIDGLIRHGENGYLCRAGDARELSGLLRQILTQRPESIRARGYQVIKTNTLENNALKYYRFIENISTIHRNAQKTR